MECDQITNLIVSSLATVIAAFAGAWFAFDLQDKKERLKEQRRQISLVNQSLFNLIRQYGALKDLKSEIEPWREDKCRYRSIPAIATNRCQDVKIKIENLNFLLDTEDQDLLMEIAIEQEKFEVALKTVELRSDFLISEFQPAFAGIGIEDGVQIYENELASKLGTRMYRTTIHYTDQMFKHVYDVHDSTLAVLKKFIACAKRNYPGEKFLAVVDDNSSSREKIA